MKTEKHEFAIFTHEVSRLGKKNHEYVIADKDLVNRISVVLRLSVGETVILFDQKNNLRCQLSALAKKEVTVSVLEKSQNQSFKPRLVWFLPLLEREAFEDALTALTVMGAQEIYPVITEKSRKAWGNEKERDRAHRVMVAACEQSKQFSLPLIHDTLQCVDLPSVCTQQKFSAQLFFDAQGAPAFDVIADLKQKSLQSLACCVGPEGDLTQQEKEQLKKAGFTFCALTPTILRASVAVEVGAALMRSCL